MDLNCSYCAELTQIQHYNQIQKMCQLLHRQHRQIFQNRLLISWSNCVIAKDEEANA